MAHRSTAAARAAKQQRTDALVRAARGIVAADGFGAASVSAIARVAGVSVGTVYTYFESREALLVAVFRQAASAELQIVRDAVSAAGREPGARAVRELTALVTTFAERAIRGRRLAWALLVEPVDALIDVERLYFRRAYSDTVAQIITRGVASGELPAQDPRIVGPGLVGLIGEALTGPLSPLVDGQLPSGQVITDVTQMCLRAIGGQR